MKKVILLLVCLLTVSVAVWADKEKPIQVGQLPTKAQTFISTHFKHHKVALAKMESDWLDKTYDVIFTNGEKVEFDKAGDWKEVKCKASSVPTAVVPVAILHYLRENYPDQHVLEMERDKKEIEVKLSNGFEIKFNHKMQVIDIDR